MKKQIFATIPPPSVKQKQFTYQNTNEHLKYQSYANNLDQKINGALNSQSKVIKGKQIQLQNELHYLQQKYYKQSQKLRKMEEYFLANCQNILKDDIQKWTNNQKFFSDILKQYQNQINIQKQINTKMKQNATNLKNQLKLALKEVFLIRINQNSQSQKQKNQKTYKKKLKTQSFENSTQQSVMTKRNAQLQLCGNFLEQQKLRRQKRAKTESSLPKLKKIQQIKKMNIDDLQQKSFMKPIGEIKKVQKQEYHLNSMVKLLKQYRDNNFKNQSNNWYQKLIFNNKNFGKIIQFLQTKNEAKNNHNQLKKQSLRSNNKKGQIKFLNDKRIKTQI